MDGPGGEPEGGAPHGQPKDVVQAKVPAFSDPVVHPLEGHCPTSSRRRTSSTSRRPLHHADHRLPEIRLRFTPAAGHIYGSNKVDDKLISGRGQDHSSGTAVYDDATKGWYLFEVPPDIDSGGGGREPGARFWNETPRRRCLRSSPLRPSWLHGNVAKSRGYLDDACDGFVFVALRLKSGDRVTAYARITSGPPMLIPDARFVRSLADDLEQALLGPKVPTTSPSR